MGKSLAATCNRTEMARGRWPRSGPTQERLRGRQERGKKKNRNQEARGRRDPTQRPGPGEKEGRQRNEVDTMCVLLSQGVPYVWWVP